MIVICKLNSCPYWKKGQCSQNFVQISNEGICYNTLNRGWTYNYPSHEINVIDVEPKEIDKNEK